jgi:hypothetical protein
VIQKCDQIESAKRWMYDFSLCVQSLDYEAAEKMFSDEATGFGTWTKKMKGLHALRIMQWEKVWSSTKDFAFDLDDGSVFLSREEGASQCVVTAGWSSIGLSGGREFVRSGCATVVLAGWNQHRWVAIHTHFSRDPEGVL